VPTYFQPVPSVLDPPGRQLDVIYPTTVDIAAARRGGGALQPLMGRTRAAVLAAAGGGATDIAACSAARHLDRVGQRPRDGAA